MSDHQQASSFVRWGPPPAIVFLLTAVFLLFRADDAGMTFDEGMILASVRDLRAWIAGDASTDAVWFGHERPSPAKLLAAAGVALFGETKFGLRVGAALLAALAATTVYAALRKPHGFAAAVTALIFLVAAPPLSAFASLASLESVATSLVLIALMRSLVATTTRDWFLCGLICGVAIATKITALLALVAVVLWAISSRPTGRISRRHALVLAGGVALGFLATWPFVLTRPSAIVGHIAEFAKTSRPPTLFFGSTAAPDWTYAPVWIAIGLPPFLLILAAIGITQSGPMTRILRIFFALALACGLLAHPYLREGLRYLLPLCAVLAVLAGVGVGALSSRRAGVGAIAAAASLATVLLGASRGDLTDSLHINGFAGGSSFALERNLPVFASGDALKREALASLPDGRYRLELGPYADHVLDFANPVWREFVSKEAALVGRAIAITDGEAEFALILGSGRDAGGVATVVARRGEAEVVAWRRIGELPAKGL